MHKQKYKNAKKVALRGLGTGAILSLAFVVTFILYQNKVQEDVYMNNYTTSVLFSDSLTVASGTAPWALLSLNWFICRSLIKRWLGLVTKWFE